MSVYCSFCMLSWARASFKKPPAQSSSLWSHTVLCVYLSWLVKLAASGLGGFLVWWSAVLSHWQTTPICTLLGSVYHQQLFYALFYFGSSAVVGFLLWQNRWEVSVEQVSESCTSSKHSAVHGFICLCSLYWRRLGFVAQLHSVWNDRFSVDSN